jgi:hypothetical protein
MSEAATGRPPAVDGLVEEEVTTVRIDDERHALVWIHDGERTVSVLVDRPLEGLDTVRVVGLFGPGEDRTAIDPLVEDYRRRHCALPRGARRGPRPLEPADLTAPGEARGRGG